MAEPAGGHKTRSGHGQGLVRRMWMRLCMIQEIHIRLVMSMRMRPGFGLGNWGWVHGAEDVHGAATGIGLWAAMCTELPI